MSFKAKILPDLFADMMLQVQIDCNSFLDSIQKPFFNHDTLLKFMNEMLEADNASVDKFPVIYLRPDFVENYKTDDIRVLYTANIELYIIHHTSADYAVSQRYEQVFKPVLIPIYESLINRIQHYRGWKCDLTHSKQDLLYWGVNNTNFVNDYIDAIHITNMNLGVFKTNCI